MAEGNAKNPETGAHAAQGIEREYVDNGVKGASELFSKEFMESRKSSDPAAKAKFDEEFSILLKDEPSKHILGHIAADWAEPKTTKDNLKDGTLADLEKKKDGPDHEYDAMMASILRTQYGDFTSGFMRNMNVFGGTGIRHDDVLAREKDFETNRTSLLVTEKTSAALLGNGGELFNKLADSSGGVGLYSIKKLLADDKANLTADQRNVLQELASTWNSPQVEKLKNSTDYVNSYSEAGLVAGPQLGMITQQSLQDAIKTNPFADVPSRADLYPPPPPPPTDNSVLAGSAAQLDSGKIDFAVAAPAAEGEVKPPVPAAEGEVKPPVPAAEGEVKPPVPVAEGEVKPPVPAAEGEVKPQVPAPATRGMRLEGEVKPPVPAAEEVKPPVPAAEEVKPPVPAAEEVKPPVPAAEEVKPPVPAAEEVKPPVPAAEEVKPPVPAAEEVKPPVPAAEGEVKPPVPAPVAPVRPEGQLELKPGTAGELPKGDDDPLRFDGSRPRKSPTGEDPLRFDGSRPHSEKPEAKPEVKPEAKPEVKAPETPNEVKIERGMGYWDAAAMMLGYTKPGTSLRESRHHINTELKGADRAKIYQLMEYLRKANHDDFRSSKLKVGQTLKHP